MKKITLLLLLTLSVLGLQAQTYQLNYDSIRVGKTAGTGGTSLYGKVYLKNVGLGVVGDSILTVLNGRIRKVPYTQITGLQDSLTKKANRTFDNVASGAIANVKLANSTISGVSLGSNLNTLALGYGLTGTSYNGTSAVTSRVDTSDIQTVANFFPKGDTRWLKSNSASGTYVPYTGANSNVSLGSYNLNATNLEATGFIAVSEDLHLLSNNRNLYGRNVANSAHVQMIGLNTSDQIGIGKGGATTVFGGSVNGIASSWSGQISANGGLLVNSTTNATTPGQYLYNSASGSTIWTKAGSVSDLTVYNNAGATVISIPTGTNKTLFNGDVGIGGASPNGRLDIKASATATWPLYIRNSSDVQIGGVYNDVGAGQFQLMDATGTAAVNITARSGQNNYITSGNLGIGITNPASKLDVNGTGNFSDALTGTAATFNSIKLINGASNGYVLKSDGSGNASWQATTSSYKGTWNASTNTPTIADGTGSTGDYYEVSTSGTQFGRSFTAGGRAIYNGSIWEPVGVSASVTSVNGYTGSVVLSKSDIGLSNVDNTSDINKPVSTAQQTALDLKANLSGANFTGTTGMRSSNEFRLYNGANDNWSLIKNSMSGTSANLEFLTGTGKSLTLNNDKSATFEGELYANAGIMLSTSQTLSTPGQIRYNSASGTSIWGKSGSVNDLTIYNNAGSTVLSIPTGTNSLSVAGSLTSANFSGSSSGTNTGDQTNITGNAATVTTNANLTGVVTSTGNATAIADAALSIAKTSGLQGALDSKAPLVSPALTGNPTAPTQTAGDNSTKIATTAYVDATTTTGSGASKQSAVIFTDVNSSSGGAIDLAQHTISTATNGDKISFEYTGNFAANTNSKPQMILTVDGTDFTIPSITPGNNEDWIISGSIIRVSSIIYKISINYFQSGQNNYPQVTSGATLDTNSLVITLTAPTTVANNDIVLSTASIQKFNAP